MTPFRLAHLSDPHLPPPPGAGATWRDLLSKRTLSRWSWARKRRRVHRPEALAPLVADLVAHAPDHVAVTGDLVNFATPAEVAAAAGWLETLGPAQRVTVSPGNHDLLVGADQAARLALWRPWLGDAGDGEAFPHVRVRDGVALINLCSARPTPPFSARGEIGARQLAALAQALDETGRAGLARVVLLHHALTPGVVKPRKALTDASALRAVLRDRGADLVLHGHAHASVFASTPGPDGPIPVLGAPSASARPGGSHPAGQWRLIEIDDAAIAVTTRGVDNGGVVAFGGYRLARQAGAFSSDSAA